MINSVIERSGLSDRKTKRRELRDGVIDSREVRDIVSERSKMNYNVMQHD